ncbi:hypothetical protein ABPG75_007420 [Micractinium tetrahymenae]
MAAQLGLHPSARPVRPSSSHHAVVAPSRPSAAPDRRQRPAVVVAAGGSGGGGGLGDELLDFMYAGKKLRKWYGAEGQVLPRDGRQPDDDPEAPQEEEPAVREYVAVLDADTSPMAEQVVLQLILNRTKIRALVKDAAAAKAAFGPYIEPGDSSDRAAVIRLLRGAQAAVCCGRLGALLPAAAAARLPHVVLLSTAGSSGGGAGLAGLFASPEHTALADASREQQLRASGLPHTIVQVAGLADAPGGASSLALSSSSASPQGKVSREDAAKALAEAAERDAAAGSLVLQLSSLGAGAPPADWQAEFGELLSVPSA